MPTVIDICHIGSSTDPTKEAHIALRKFYLQKQGASSMVLGLMIRSFTSLGWCFVKHLLCGHCHIHGSCSEQVKDQGWDLAEA